MKFTRLLTILLYSGLLFSQEVTLSFTSFDNNSLEIN